MRDHLLFVALSLVWGTSFILMKWANPCFGPLSIAASRLLFGGALVLGIGMMVGARIKIGKKDWPYVIAIAVFGAGLPFSLQPFLIASIGNSAFIGTMVCFVPVFTAIVSVPMLKKKPDMVEMIALAVGLICLFSIMWDGIHRSITVVNLGLAALTPLLYATCNTTVRSRLSHCSPLSLTSLTYLLAAIPVVILAGSIEPFPDPDHPEFSMALGSLFALGAFCTGIAGYFFFMLIRRRGPLYAGMVGYMIPLIATCIGWCFGEEVSGVQWACMVTTMLSVGCVQARQKLIPQKTVA